MATLNGVDMDLFINKVQLSGGPICLTSIFSIRTTSSNLNVLEKNKIMKNCQKTRRVTCFSFSSSKSLARCFNTC
jgi:hypothetical protein